MMNNTIDIIISTLFAVSGIDVNRDVLSDETSVDVYTEVDAVYGAIMDTLEGIGAVEDWERTETLMDFVAPDEDMYYMVYVLNGVVITVQLDRM